MSTRLSQACRSTPETGSQILLLQNADAHITTTTVLQSSARTSRTLRTRQTTRHRSSVREKSTSRQSSLPSEFASNSPDTFECIVTEKSPWFSVTMTVLVFIFPFLCIDTEKTASFCGTRRFLPSNPGFWNDI